jgi:hypothetical protein
VVAADDPVNPAAPSVPFTRPPNVLAPDEAPKPAMPMHMDMDMDMDMKSMPGMTMPDDDH